MEAVRTTCPYCGVGCGVLASSDGTVKGDPEHPANFGRLCSKGSALGETIDLDGRLLYPEVDGKRVDWDMALTRVAEGFAEVVARKGADAVAFYVSGQLLTEDYYAANKLIKGWIGTANIDTNSRLCMASSVAGHKRAFGSDTVPGNYEDLELADLIVLVGSNLAWCHPVLHQRILAARAKRGGLPRLIVIDPRRTASCEGAERHLALRAGTDVALFAGLHAHLKGGAPDLAAVARICGLPTRDIAAFYAEFARTEKVVTVYSQGVNQSSAGVDKVNAIINCHLATGRIGRPGMGPFSVTGQPNAMGGREVGALANQLAAHMDFAAEDVDRVARFWVAPLVARKPGLKAVDLFAAIERGEIEAVWIMATNPAASLPDADRVRAALAKCKLVVVSDCVARTDTLDHAHVKLPALAWGEKDGTVTNSERRISRQRPFLPAPGEAKQDWWIVAEVAKRMGAGDAFAWSGPAEIFAEHARLSAFENAGTRDFDLSSFLDLDFAALEPTQWGGARFFADGRYFTPDRRPREIATPYRGPRQAPGASAPFVLNTGRVRDHWHTMTRTGKSPRLAGHLREAYAAVSPEDARARGLADGGFVHLASNWGDAVLRVRVEEGQRKGEIFAPFHWTGTHAARARVNALVNPEVDPISGQPELKHTPVSIAPWAPAWEGFLLRRKALASPPVAYWVASAGGTHTRYELADASALDDAAIASLLGDGQRLDYADPAGGRRRIATIIDGKLDALLFVGPRESLPDGAWLAMLFGKPVLDAEDRRAALAGAPPMGGETGALICACHGVRKSAVDRAIAGGCRTAAEIGAATRAGTNCGSCVPELAAMLAQPMKAAAE
ncbi:MAG: molybdopterin-dependent oxidoreductase [Tagaea sp.]|nr:molybdopterin-dependent oxidoreductase [Tagaea sp.]